MIPKSSAAIQRLMAISYLYEFLDPLLLLTNLVLPELLELAVTLVRPLARLAPLPSAVLIFILANHVRLLLLNLRDLLFCVISLEFPLAVFPLDSIHHHPLHHRQELVGRPLAASELSLLLFFDFLTYRDQDNVVWYLPC